MHKKEGRFANAEALSLSVNQLEPYIESRERRFPMIFLKKVRGCKDSNVYDNFYVGFRWQTGNVPFQD